MSPYVQPYLFLGGRCEAALRYYGQHLGARLGMQMRFRESPEPHPGTLPEGWGEKIMHSEFTIGSSVLMASDGMSNEMPKSSHCMSISYATEREARDAFAALAEGGSVFMPLGKTFFSDCFGMVTDQFGIQWMITLQTPPVT